MTREDIIKSDLEDIYLRDIPWDNLRGKTVFLTGAYGMLGSYVMYFLIYLNEVRHMDIRIIAGIRSHEKFCRRFGLYAWREYVGLYQEPLERPIELEEKVDYIIHAASLASPQHYAVRPVEVMKPNVLGSYYLLELAKEKRVRGFLLFSTGDIYGKVEGKDSITERDCGIMDTLDVHSCYGESKRMAETMSCAYWRQYGIPIRILRIWHTYGPTMDIENDPRVFASFMKNLIRGENIELKSDGSGKRCFCYIADAMAGYFTVMLRGEDGEAYNVCNSGQFYSIRELAEMTADLFPEKNLKVVVRKRDGHESYVENSIASAAVPDDSKLRRLGWKPHFDTEEGFRRVAECLRQSL